MGSCFSGNRKEKISSILVEGGCGDNSRASWPIMNWLAIRIIRSYQSMGGSKLLNVDCNFTPSCSNYAEECFVRFDFWTAIKLTVSRLRRCNIPDLPSKKFDPVPLSCERTSH